MLTLKFLDLFSVSLRSGHFPSHFVRILGIYMSMSLRVLILNFHFLVALGKSSFNFLSLTVFPLPCLVLPACPLVETGYSDPDITCEFYCRRVEIHMDKPLVDVKII